MVLGTDAEFTWKSDFQLHNPSGDEPFCLRTSMDQPICDNCSIIDYLENNGILRDLEMRKLDSRSSFTSIIRPNSSTSSLRFTDNLASIEVQARGEYSLYSGPFDIDNRDTFAFFDYAKPYTIGLVNRKTRIEDSTLLFGNLRMFAYKSQAQDSELSAFNDYARGR
jgi:hypothetical protein